MDTGETTMEYVKFDDKSTIGNILCCECAAPIAPNPSNMCVGCIRTRVDITSEIPKQVTIYFCRGCERYLQPPTEWVRCSLESRELLSFCLKKLKGLGKLKLIDAGFIWTEPHSKRIKVKLTVHGDVIGGTTLEQVFVVEYTVAHQMCPDCHRTEAQEYWKCLVQVRQRCDHKKTFYYLEQLILKHKAHANTLGIKPHHEGLDFYYATEGHASKMVDFISSVLPIKWAHSRKMISQDIHSNTFNCKFTWSVEIVPISKDCMVCLPKKLTNQLGGLHPLCIVQRVASSIHLIHPATGQVAEVTANLFWRQQFKVLCGPKQLTEFTVIDLELLPPHEQQKFRGQGAISQKHLIADAWVVKSSELGLDDSQIHTRTHLGAILKPGDAVMGYMLADLNANDENFERLDQDRVPDVMLVKKFYADKSARRRARNWKLKHLNEDMTNYDKQTDDFEEFLEDLEEDPLYRQNVNIFKESGIPLTEEEDEEGYPRITLSEMLEDLQLDEPEEKIEVDPEEETE